MSVTVPLTGVSVLPDYIRWTDNYSIGSLFSADGAEQILSLVDLNSNDPAGRVVISISGINNRFTPAFEASGRIIFEASDGETLEVTIGNADMSEIYQWVPANSIEVVAFVNHIRTLTDQTGTITLREEGEEEAPLSLSDFVVPAGRISVFAGLIEIEVSGEEVYRPASDIGSLVDGDLDLASNISLNRFRVRSDPRVQFNRSGAGIVRDFLDDNEDGIFHFQDSDGVDTEAVSAILDGDRLNGGANLRGAALVSRVDDLVTGDLLIVAFTLPPVIVNRAGDGTPIEITASLGDATGRSIPVTVGVGRGTPLEIRASLGEATGRSTSLFSQPADIARAQSFSLTGRKPIYALEITHPSITDNVLAVGDSQGVTLEGNAYPALGFRARLPQDKEGEVRQASLEIDNVGRELVQWVEASEGGPGGDHSSYGDRR